MFEGLDRVKITLDIVAAIRKIRPFAVVNRPSCELLDVFSDSLPVHLVVAVGHSNSDDGKIGGKQLERLEIVKCRQQLSFGEIPGCAENHNRARVCGVFVAGQGLFGHCNCY